MKPFSRYSIAFLLVASTAEPTLAAENGTTNYPPGVPGAFLGAFPPIPGLFLDAQTGYTSNSNLYDSHGNKTQTPYHFSAEFQVLRFLASYPDEFLGARLYSEFVAVGALYQQSVAGVSSSANGVSNFVLAPLLFNWFLTPNQNLIAGAEIMTNSGNYSAGDPLNVATNYATFSPLIVYRYADQKGFELAISPRLLLNGSNNDSFNTITGARQQYRSGNAAVVDFNFGYHIGNWQLGVVGGYAQQFTKDTVNGVTAFNTAGVQDGNRIKTLNLGPSVIYDFGAFAVNLNWQHTFVAENTTKGDTVWCSIVLPVLLPPSATNQVAAKY